MPNKFIYSLLNSKTIVMNSKTDAQPYFFISWHYDHFEGRRHIEDSNGTYLESVPFTTDQMRPVGSPKIVANSMISNKEVDTGEKLKILYPHIEADELVANAFYPFDLGTDRKETLVQFYR